MVLTESMDYKCKKETKSTSANKQSIGVSTSKAKEKNRPIKSIGSKKIELSTRTTWRGPCGRIASISGKAEIPFSVRVLPWANGIIREGAVEIYLRCCHCVRSR